MNIAEVLAHPTMKAADPVVRAGTELVNTRDIRWVHSSEVLDIGLLLRGGELLLTGGEALASAPDEKQKQYVRELAARNVAALAIETCSDLDGIPASIIETAETESVILIELRAVVPFVVITESINSAFVSDSVAMLQKAEELSHTIAVDLAAGAELRDILGVIAAELSASVSLLVPGTFSRDLVDIADPSSAGEAVSDPIEVEIPLRGIVAAALQIEIADPGEEAYVRTVGERVADVLGLALLQQRPPSLSDIAGVQLIRAVANNERGAPLADLCASAGIEPTAPLVLIAARSTEPNRLRGKFEHTLAGLVPRSVFYATPGELIGLVVLSDSGRRAKRRELITELELSLVAGDGTVCVGPLVSGAAAGYRSLTQAEAALKVAPVTANRAVVVDSDDYLVDRMLAEHLGIETKQELMDELLQELIEHDARRGTSLMDTLETWLISGCNTTASARALFLERQSMHNRLQKIFSLIGGDPRGTGRVGSLFVALRVYRQATGTRTRN